jgi:predicted secreted protein
VNAVGVVIAFILIWWTIFFAVLPFGVRSRWESEDDGVKGADPGAPTAPDLKRKVAATTLAAALLTAITAAVLASGLIQVND